MTLNQSETIPKELNVSNFRDTFDLYKYGLSVLYLASTRHLIPNRPTAVYAFHDTGEREENPSYWRFFFDENDLKISMEEFESRCFKDHERRFIEHYIKSYRKKSTR